MEGNLLRLSIVIPCYNESKNIPFILERARSVIDRDDIEIVLVNNGSTDDSRLILDQNLPSCRVARVVEVEVNKGYGFGILAGLAESRGEFLGWTHADMQTDLGDVVTAFDIIESRGRSPNIYVKGRRTGRSAFDTFFTVGMSVFESLYLSTPLWDINAQPNVFHRRFFKSWRNPPYDFSLDLFALYSARKQGLDIVRFPVRFPERIHGQSKWNTGPKAKWKFITRTLNFSVTLKRDLSRWSSLPIE